MESVKGVPSSRAAACSVGRVKDALGSCGSLRISMLWWLSGQECGGEQEEERAEAEVS